MSDLTPTQRRNLARLAIFLRRGCRCEFFGQGYAVRLEGYCTRLLYPSEVVDANDIVLDPIGHAVLMGEPPLDREDWPAYSRRVLGAACETADDPDTIARFHWMFGSRWRGGRKDAARRIAFALECGVGPEMERVALTTAREDDAPGFRGYRMDVKFLKWLGGVP